MIHCSHKVRSVEAEVALQNMTAEQYGRYLSDKEAKSYVNRAMSGAKSVVRALSFRGVKKAEATTQLIKGLATQHGVHHLLLDFCCTLVKEKLA